MPRAHVAPATTLDWSTNDERRSAPRHPAAIRVRCWPVTQGHEDYVEVAVRDLSTWGIGLILDWQPAHGDLLEIELRRKSGAFVRRVLARVVHVEEQTLRSWVVGCAFAAELGEADLALFKAHAEHPAEPDLRRWTRFPCDLETICTTHDTAPGERRAGKIINASAGGVGILLRCEFSVGTLLQFKLPAHLDPGGRTLVVRVVRVSEQDDGNWFLGCEFADQLTKDELRGLLR